MYNNVLSADGAGVLMFAGTNSLWYDLASLWYDFAVFALLATWTAFRSSPRTWSLPLVGQELGQKYGDLK